MEKFIYGKPVANKIYKEVSIKIDLLKKKEIKPCIAVIIVGNRKDSITYVNMKANKCTELGISSEIHKLEETCKETDILEKNNEVEDDKSAKDVKNSESQNVENEKKEDKKLENSDEDKSSDNSDESTDSEKEDKEE